MSDYPITFIENAGRRIDQPLPVPGVELGAVATRLRYRDRPSFGLVICHRNTTCHVVTTQSSCPAAPVLLVRDTLEQNSKADPWLLYVISGNANAATGQAGIEVQEELSLALVNACKNRGIKCNSQAILPFATGVIGEPLATDTLMDSFEDLLDSIGTSEKQWIDFARSMMTTDTYPKWVSRQVECEQGIVTITGIAKGAAMVSPNMATMLGWVFCDAVIDSNTIAKINRDLTAATFNRISIDSDTSTNDCVALVGTGVSGVDCDEDPQTHHQVMNGLRAVYDELSQSIIQDAEGRNKIMLVEVKHASTDADADAVCRAVVDSPLWKAALSAGDPNWGRLIMAIGKAKVDRDANLANQLDLNINAVSVLQDGVVDPSYSEQAGQQALAAEFVRITIDLKAGNGSSHCFGSDLTEEYVRLNADYRT